MKIPPTPAIATSMFYNIYHQLAKELRIPYVPFVMGDDSLTKNMMQAHGLHSNAQGQPFIAKKVWSQLLPLLK